MVQFNTKYSYSNNDNSIKVLDMLQVDNLCWECLYATSYPIIMT